jgi:hypothetical protein
MSMFKSAGLCAVGLVVFSGAVTTGGCNTALDTKIAQIKPACPAS